MKGFVKRVSNNVIAKGISNDNFVAYLEDVVNLSLSEDEYWLAVTWNICPYLNVAQVLELGNMELRKVWSTISKHPNIHL